MNLTDEFKKLWKNQIPDASMLVPLMTWCSGTEKNIELCQRINKKFYKGNHKVLIGELALSNTLKHFIKYPKGFKEDEKMKFFFEDICKYFGWTMREFHINEPFLFMNNLKEVIAKKFGYNNSERKIIGLKLLTFPKTKNAKKRI